MSPEDWDQVKTLFRQAQSLEPAQRKEFLDVWCGNKPVVRAEVESLLNHSNGAGSFLQNSPLGAGALSPLVETISMKPTSALLKSRYQLERELSHGGLGVVYLATDTALHDRRVVIKVPLASQLGEPWVVEKFAQEIRALSLIDHPGVVSVYDSGLTPEGFPFFAMQFVEGVSLRHRMTPAGMGLQEAAGILRQIGAALKATHQKGIWHRDLKPENVMLQPMADGVDHVKLIDFGIATIIEKNSAEAQTRIAGTIAYMAPEQLQGRVCQATDVFSLGVIAFEILTGQKPFDAASPVDLYEKQAAGVAIKPSAIRPEIPPAAESLVLSALSFRVHDRPQDAGQWGAALADALQPVSSTPQPRRRSLLYAAIAAIVIATGGVGLWRIQTANNATLNYSVLVEGSSGAGAHLATLRTPFAVTDAFHLLLRSSRPGHIYVLSDDGASGGLNVLFPAPFMYKGSSAIGAGDIRQIPERSAFHFDAPSSQLDIWLVWSGDAVPELERLEKYMNPTDRGAISNPADRSQIRALLDAAREGARVSTNSPTEDAVSSTRSRLAWKVGLRIR